MRDLVLEKASPIAFLFAVVAALEGPRNLARGILYEVCMNLSISFAAVGEFFH